jgi:sRNA-binding carbon storage regulator CsrA
MLVLQRYEDESIMIGNEIELIPYNIKYRVVDIIVLQNGRQLYKWEYLTPGDEKMMKTVNIRIVKIECLRTGRPKVKLGFEADPSIAINRKELWEEKQVTHG